MIPTFSKGYCLSQVKKQAEISVRSKLHPVYDQIKRPGCCRSCGRQLHSLQDERGKDLAEGGALGALKDAINDRGDDLQIVPQPYKYLGVNY